MKVDAHLHLSEIGADSLNYVLKNDICVIGSCHRAQEVEFTKKLKARKDQKTGKIYISAGVHPFDLNENNLRMVEDLAQKSEIDAIGEIGLDKFSQKEKMSFEIQRKFLEKQLELAVQHKLPVILHIRKAMNELFEYEKHLKMISAVIFHSYSGSLNEARHILDKGINAFFSFGTTLGNGHKKAIEAVKELPLETLLTETDAPYQPFKGNEITKAEDIERVVADTAEIKGVEFLKIEKEIYNNLKRTLTKIS